MREKDKACQSHIHRVWTGQRPVTVALADSVAELRLDSNMTFPHCPCLSTSAPPRCPLPSEPSRELPASHLAQSLRADQASCTIAKHLWFDCKCLFQTAASPVTHRPHSVNSEASRTVLFRKINYPSPRPHTSLNLGHTQAPSALLASPHSELCFPSVQGYSASKPPQWVSKISPR